MTELPDPCATCGYPMPDEACALCDGEIVAVDGITTIQPGRRFFAIELIEGFLSLFQASLLLMTKKEYMGKIGLAALVNMVLFVVFAGGCFFGFWELIGYIFGTGGEGAEEASGWVTAGTASLSLILAILAMWFLAPTLIETGMIPFLDPIANATEKMLAGDKMKPVELGMWKGLLAGMNAAAQVLVLQVLLLLPIILLTWMLPLLAPILIPLGLVVSGYLNAMVWFEIPVLRRGYGMRIRRRIIRRNWPRAVGFGLAINFGLLVPFFNIFFLGPAAAVATSMLYFRFDKSV